MPEVPIITPLEKFYQYENENAHKTFLRQAINDQWVHYSWKRVGDEARRMAAVLKQMKLSKGSRIGILSNNCAHWIMSDLAIMMAGHVSVPLYPTISADLVDYCLTHSEAKVCFVGKLDGWEKQQKGVPKGVRLIHYPDYPQSGCENWNDLIKNIEPVKENYIPKLSDISTIIYTSGTTGVPKGVMHSFEAISYAPTWVLKEMEHLMGNDKFFSFLQLAHIAERMLIEMGAIYSGACVSFAESIEKVPQNLKDTNPTVFLAVPLIWTRMQHSILARLPQERLDRILKIPLLSDFVKKRIKEGAGLGNCKYIISGAAPIPVSMLEWFNKLDIKICEAYGLSENCAYSHGNRIEYRKLGYVGQPMPNTEVKISKEGEILVKNRCRMLGYYKDPEKTKEAITKDGFLRTGDQGEIDEEGFLKITGRIKEIFKTDKGKYVAPAPIELELSKDEHISQVCVVGSNLKQPIAMVVLAPEIKEKDTAEITASLEKTLAEVNSTLDKHEKVKKIIVMHEDWTVDNGLITPTLKIKRNELEKLKQDNFQFWYNRDDTVVWED